MGKAEPIGRLAQRYRPIAQTPPDWLAIVVNSADPSRARFYGVQKLHTTLAQTETAGLREIKRPRPSLSNVGYAHLKRRR